VKKIIQIILISILISCNYFNPKSEEGEIKKSTTSIFRSSEYYLIFRLNINDDYTYSDSFRNENVTLGYKIGDYSKSYNRPSLIKLQINDKDTSFYFPLHEVDSILFGLTGGFKRNFYIVTNKSKSAWVID
jgi:hypothetical protein